MVTILKQSDLEVGELRGMSVNVEEALEVQRMLDSLLQVPDEERMRRMEAISLEGLEAELAGGSGQSVLFDLDDPEDDYDESYQLDPEEDGEDVPEEQEYEEYDEEEFDIELSEEARRDLSEPEFWGG